MSESRQSDKKAMVKNFKPQSQIFKFIFVVLLALVLSSFIVKCSYDTTVTHADKWNELAMEEMSKVKIVRPKRGNILASDGSVLATTQTHYTLRIDYRSEKFMTDTFLTHLDVICDSLAFYFPQRTQEEWKNYLSEPLGRDTLPRAHLLLKDISHADNQKVRSWPFFKIKNSNRTGLTEEARLLRSYPYGTMARRSIGRVCEEKATGEVHGYSGLECALDGWLYGKEGKTKKVALTNKTVDMVDTAAQDGYNVRSTINITIQDIVEQELGDMLQTCGAEWGSVVLMKVETGDIVAISNLDHDPRTGRLREGLNRAVLGYEPGSVIKTVSMTLALDDKLVRDTSQVISIGPSYAYAGGRPITDSHVSATLKVSEILEHSSNIGMTKVMTLNSIYSAYPSKFRERLAQAGFFDKINSGIAGEQIPHYPRVEDNKGGRIAFSRQTYGYNTEVSPLALVGWYNAIANNGRYVRPRLVKGFSGNGIDSTIPVSYIRDRLCSEETAKKMQALLTKVVTGSRGTARSLRNPTVTLAGKTGTCYIVEGKRYNQSKRRVSFIGFFPAEKPVYSCAVVVSNPKNPRGAASVSGKVMKEIALKLYARGLLDNVSDYTTSISEDADIIPSMYATSNPSAQQDAMRELYDGKIARDTVRTSVAGCVPDARGLVLRDAISLMESSGLNVKIKGTGCVESQTPNAGAELVQGSEVLLSLSVEVKNEVKTNKN